MPVTGLKELNRKLEELGKLAEVKIMRAAMRAAMKPALEAARAAAPEGDRWHKTYTKRPVGPGFTKRSVRLVTVKPRSPGKFRMIIGVRAEAFYALQFIELGTSRIPRKPWLEPSFEQSQGAVKDALGEELKKRIEKIAKANK